MPEKRQIGAAITLIKKFEGCKLTAYQDSGGVWTIGYGHTGTDVTPGLTITQERAEQLLLSDIERCINGLDKMVPSTINDSQYCALLSFVFNLGLGTLKRSSLLGCVLGGDTPRAGAEFGKWVHDAGVVLPGLVARREAERKLFLGIA